MKPYDPTQSVEPKQWLALDEGERIILVQDYVDQHESEVEGAQLHAALHMLVENQIALGDETPVAVTLERLIAEGLKRHEAIHAIASCFAELLFAISKGETPQPERYFNLVTELTAKKWLAM